MRKLFSFCAIVALFLMVGCSTFLTNLFGTHYETFELTLDGQKVVVNLPNELPSMEDAVIGGGGCFNTKVCYARYCLSVDPMHDHIDFVHTNTDVIALVWIKTNETEFEKRYIAWIYFKGIPVPASIDKVKELLKEHSKPDKVPGAVLFKDLDKDLAELQALIFILNRLTTQDL